MSSDYLEPAKSSLSGKKILVTGASGYLASNLVKWLSSVDCSIIRVSRKAQLPSVEGRAQLEDVQGDVGDVSLWERVMEKVDVVYHFAAQTSVYVADQDPVQDWKINVLPLLNLLETCRKKQVRPIVIFSGTVTEVGIPKTIPVNEQPKDLPVTVYDLHKLWAEQYLLHYVREGVVQGSTIRLSNVYGPGPESSSADRGIINLMMRKAVAGETLTIYGNGKCLRDYIFIDDAIDAFLKAPNCIEKVNGDYFVLGSGEGNTIAEVINMIANEAAKRISKRVKVKHIEPPFRQSPIEARNFVADTSRFSKASDWKAQVMLKEGINRTLDHLMKQ